MTSESGSGSLLDRFRIAPSVLDGLQRIRAIFEVDNMGVQTFEMKMIKSVTFVAFTVGCFTAGSAEMPQAKRRFQEQHNLSLFTSQRDANSRLFNYMTLSFWKAGGRLGVRVAAFAFSYVSALASLAAYKNCLKYYHFPLAGAIAGGVYRANFGLRASFASGVIGSLLGAGNAMLIFPLVILSGRSLAQLFDEAKREFHQQQLESKEKAKALSEIQSQYNVWKWEAEAIWKANQIDLSKQSD